MFFLKKVKIKIELLPYNSSWPQLFEEEKIGKAFQVACCCNRTHGKHTIPNLFFEASDWHFRRSQYLVFGKLL